MSQKFKSEVELQALNNAATDTDKFLVSDSGTIKYRTGAQILSDLGVSGIYVPYTGATGNVDLGTHTLSSYNLIVNHTSGSGVAASITKGGSGEALTINKTSGSGNAMSVTGGLTSLVDLTLSSIANATIDTDRFIVSDGGAIKYRTGAQVLSDIGGQATLTNPITGTGTTNYLSKFTGTTSLGNSQIFDNGTNVGIGTTSPSAKLHLLQPNTFNTADIFSIQHNFLFGNLILTANDFVVKSTGNVGINTASPGYKLHVNGTLRSSNITIADYIIHDGDTNTYMGFPSTDTISWNTNGSERMRINSSGNVGIGTSSPSGFLTLSKSGETTFDITDIGGHSKRFFVRNSDKTLGIYNNDTGQQRTQFRLLTGTGATNDRLSLLEAGGNVGIGTSSPVAKLDIGGASGEMIRLADSSTIGNPFISFFQTSTRRAYIQYVDSGDNLTLASEYGGIVLATGTNGNEAEKMRITSSGNVGIGTTSPVRALQVGNFSGNPEICIASGTTGVGGLTFGDGAGGNDPWRGFIQYNHATDAMIIGTNNAGWLTLTNGGALGLNVNPTNTAGRFEASNDIVAYSSSDKRWKTNIKNIDSPLEKISQINGVEFDWIEDEPVHGNKGHDIGVIAQEIEKILPDAVQTRESGMKAVKYEKVIPLLIESIKEQQKQIEELKQILNGITN